MPEARGSAERGGETSRSFPPDSDGRHRFSECPFFFHLFNRRRVRSTLPYSNAACSGTSSARTHALVSGVPFVLRALRRCLMRNKDDPRPHTTRTHTHAHTHTHAQSACSPCAFSPSPEICCGGRWGTLGPSSDELV